MTEPAARWPLERYRAVSIIAHIDHGKSTLADRILELCGAVDPRDMRAQYLDSMDLERERGITIKAQNVRLRWKDHVVHLIDTPGHVDFGYEVSRSLAACEGAILLVDSSQGIEAQTLANCYAALDADLTIVAALNKIDLPQAEPDKRAEEIERVLGIPADQVLRISAKTGEGVPELLDAVVAQVPAPLGDPDAPLRALIFDSYYDAYRGVISAVRVFDGTLVSGARLRYVQAGQNHDAEEVGVRRPAPTPVALLGPGEVGYLIAGIKDVGEARVGETVTTAAHPGAVLPGYRDPKPMVFCGLYPIDGDEYADLPRGAREAAPERLVVHVRTRDVGGAGLRLPVRVPRSPAHGDHPRATGARVRPVARRHGAERRVRGPSPRPARPRSSTTRPRCRRRTRSSGSRSPTSP